MSFERRNPQRLIFVQDFPDSQMCQDLEAYKKSLLDFYGKTDAAAATVGARPRPQPCGFYTNCHGDLRPTITNPGPGGSPEKPTPSVTQEFIYPTASRSPQKGPRSDLWHWLNSDPGQIFAGLLFNVFASFCLARVFNAWRKARNPNQSSRPPYSQAKRTSKVRRESYFVAGSGRIV